MSAYDNKEKLGLRVEDSASIYMQLQKLKEEKEKLEKIQSQGQQKLQHLRESVSTGPLRENHSNVLAN